MYLLHKISLKARTIDMFIIYIDSIYVFILCMSASNDLNNMLLQYPYNLIYNCKYLSKY